MRIPLNNLLPGTQYAVQVRAVAGDAVSKWSRKFDLLTIVDDEVPAIPQNVALVARGSTFVGTWNEVITKQNGKPLNNFNYYRIRVTSQLDTEIMTYTRVDERFEFDINMNRTVFGVVRPSIGIEVRAQDANGLFGAYSPIVYATAAAPDPPVIDSVVGILDGVSLAWHSDDVDVVGYRVYASTTPGFTPSYLNMVWEGDATSYTYYTSTYALHYFAVATVDDFGLESAPAFGQATPISPFVFDDVPPVLPTGLAVADLGSGKVKISWVFGVDEGLAGFNIRYRPVADLDYTLLTIPPDAREHIETLSNTVSDYEFQVRSFDTYANKSAWTAIVTKSGAPNTAPATPTGLALISGVDSLTAKWNSNTEGDMANGAGIYRVQIDTVSTFNSVNLKTYDTGANSLTVSGFANGTYYFRVKAVDSLGLESAYTIFASIATSAFPPPPTLSEISLASLITTSAGNLDIAGILKMAATGQIKSANYVTGVSGYSLSTSGLEIVDGTIKASAIIAGTISSSGVRIGGGGLITIDAAGGIQSNNYAIGSSGWKLDSTGLEINGGTIKANAIKGGTISASTIEMGSTGYIQSSGYTGGSGYRLDSSGITILNGTISATTITTGSLRSTAAAVDTNGTAIAGQYAWQIDLQGDAILGNAWVRGRIVVGQSAVASSGVIQSYNWSPGSAGWKIGSDGLVEFNGAVIGAGSFRSQNATGRVELGNTGTNDPVDELRMWNSYTVSSIRNPTALPGVIFMSFSGGKSMTFGESALDAWTYIRGSTGDRLKFLAAGNGIQIRNSGDTGYSNFAAGPTTISGTLDVQGQLQMNGYNISGADIVYGGNGTARIHAAADGWPAFSGSGNNTHRVKLLATAVQIRNSADSGPGNFYAANIYQNSVQVTSFLKYKDNVKKIANLDTASIIKNNGLHSWDWKPEYGDSGSNIPASDCGVIADYLPDFIVDKKEGTLSLGGLVGFLWESLKQSNERIEKLENIIKEK